MTAYNHLVASGTCPVCGRLCNLHFQMHVGASYDGDDTGRFALRAYRLGDRLAWWPESDARHADWAEEGDTAVLPGRGDVTERCYGACEGCRAELLATVVFRNLQPVEVADLTAECGQPRAAI